MPLLRQSGHPNRLTKIPERYTDGAPGPKPRRVRLPALYQDEPPAEPPSLMAPPENILWLPDASPFYSKSENPGSTGPPSNLF